MKCKIGEEYRVADTAAEDDLIRLTTVYENMKPKDAAALFEKYWKIFAIRTKNLQQEILEVRSSSEINSWQITATTHLTELDIFLTRASKHPSIGALGLGLLKISDETYLLELEDQQTETINVKELANILGENSLKGTRVTLLSDNTNSDTKSENLKYRKCKTANSGKTL